MAYVTISVIGVDLTSNVDTEKKFPLGYRVKAVDPTFGEGEFIYLKGVASLVAGNTVVYDEAFATTRTVAASRGPVAVALGATIANLFGWFQIVGIAAVTVLASDAADVAQFLTATAGSIDDAIVTNQKIDGCTSMSAVDTPSTGKAYMALSYPYANSSDDA